MQRSNCDKPYTTTTKLALTFDTDWVPAFVLEDVLALLQNIPATFMVTDQLAANILSGTRCSSFGFHKLILHIL